MFLNVSDGLGSVSVRLFDASNGLGNVSVAQLQFVNCFTMQSKICICWHIFGPHMTYVFQFSCCNKIASKIL